MNELKANLSGKWTIHWAPLIILMPISVLIVPVVRSVKAEDYWQSVIASLLGYLTLLAWFGICWFIFYRAGNASWWMIFGISFLAGAILSRGIDAYLSLLGLEDYIIGFRVLDTTLIIWSIGIPILGIVMNRLRNFITSRDALVGKLLENDKPILEFEIDDEFRDLLTSRKGIGDSEYQQLAGKLREFAFERVRPISHQLWAQEMKRKSRFPFFGLVGLAITKNPMPPVFFSALALSLMAVTAISQYEPLMGGVYFVLDAVIFLILLFIFRRLFPNGSWLAVVLYPLLMGSLIFTARVLIRPELATEQIIGGWITLILWLFTSLIFAGGIVLSNRTQEQILSELKKSLSEGQKITQLQAEVNQFRAADLAKYVHGTIQSKLMAYSLKLEQAITSADELEADRIRTAARDLVINPLREYEPRARENVMASLAELQANWHGLVEIAIDITVSEKFLPAAVFDIVSEGVGNAHKHAFAERVNVKINSVRGDLEIEITDDGIGPRENSRGQGMSMIDSQSGGAWSFGPAENGHGSTLRVSLKPQEMS